MGETVVDTRRNVATAILRREDPPPMQGTFRDYFRIFCIIPIYFVLLGQNTQKYVKVLTPRKMRGPRRIVFAGSTLFW